MGFSRELFLDLPPTGHICGLCSNVLEQPLRMPCGRVYCNSCINKSLQENGRCPAERCKCPHDLIVAQLTAACELHNTILNMRVRCPECLTQGVLVELQHHLQTCVGSVSEDIKNRNTTIGICQG